MRKIINFNDGWTFYKGTADVNALDGGELISLPHSWNAVDGQDGGNDYFRGSCIYTKTLSKSEVPEGMETYLEIQGANSSAKVFLNGEEVFSHDGGYSTFRVNLTEKLKDENVIAILVDNAPNDRVYPQMADFTFYGGLYRDVNLIFVNKTRQNFI